MLVSIAALTIAFYVPTTPLFEVLTRWCAHAALPFITSHLGLSGHGIGDAAIMLPAFVIAISAGCVVLAVARTTRAMRRWLKRSSLGTGPDESVIVGGEEVVVAAAGIRSPKIIVSTGALARLDEDELAASIAHERGHITRRHPFIVLAANLAYAVARPMPGTKDAFQRLRFCLERDADEYAVDRTRDPIALASAICKAAVDSPTPNVALATLAGSGAPARLRLLLDRPATRPKAWVEIVGRSLVVVTVASVLLAVGATPTLAKNGHAALHASPPAHSCD